MPPSLSSPLFTARDISYRYPTGGPFELHADVSVQPGTIVAVMGANGGGKSTLLRCLAGVAKHDGVLEVGGSRMDDPRVFASRRAFVPQFTANEVPYDVLDYLALAQAHRTAWFRGAANAQSARAVLDELGFEFSLNASVRELSGGQRQGLALARALLQEPALFVLDEPFTALDLNHRARAVSALKKRVSQGASVIVSLHDVGLAAEIADEVWTVRDGQIVDRKNNGVTKERTSARQSSSTPHHD